MKRYDVNVYFYDKDDEYDVERLTENPVSKEEAERVKEDILRNPRDYMYMIDKVEIRHIKRSKGDIFSLILSVIIGFLFMTVSIYNKFSYEPSEAEAKAEYYMANNVYEMEIKNGKTYRCEFVSLYRYMDTRPLYIITIKYNGEYKSARLISGGILNTDFSSESLVSLYEMKPGRIYDITKNGSDLVIDKIPD